jgi:hypothetical protein
VSRFIKRLAQIVAQCAMWAALALLVPLYFLGLTFDSPIGDLIGFVSQMISRILR